MKFKPAHKRGAVLVEWGLGEKEMLPFSSVNPAAPAAGFTLKKLLVPVDFSEPSRKAVGYALAFARQFKAELTLLHVIRLYPLVPEMAPVDVESVEDARRELKAWRAQIGEEIPCQLLLRSGDPSAEILAAGQELNVDLIVMGTQEYSGLARLVLGGTVKKLLRHAACPVLVVREHEHEFIPQDALRLAQNEKAQSLL